LQTVDTIPLRFAGAGRIARLRELTGRDEYAVSGASTASAIDLLASLLDRPQAGETDPVHAVDLIAADRDRLLAVVCERAFGDRVESTLTCARCSQPFNLHFSLRKLIESVDERSVAGEWKALGNGRFEGIDGVRFRLPTGNEELVAARLSTAEAESFLLNQTVEESDWRQDRTAFEELLGKVAPLISIELLASCTECSHVHTIQFDIQSYLLGAIAGERRRLLAEINRIAGTYAWSLDEILSLTRSDRRQLVELIENDNVI
jgi:hypothetical protein